MFVRLKKNQEGEQVWQPTATDERRMPTSAAVGIAWWRDHLDRAHVRVAGPAVPFGSTGAGLARVYPGRTLVHRVRSGLPVLLACCACGAAGPVKALGWMGDVCGPCHDRRLAGEPAVLWPGEAGVQDVGVVGWRLATLSRQGMVLVYQLGEDRPVNTVDVGETASGLLLSPDGNLVVVQRPASASGGGLHLEVYEVATGGSLGEWPGGMGDLSFAADGNRLFRLWRENRTCRPADSPLSPAGHWSLFDEHGDAQALSRPSSDGFRLATLERASAHLVLWDPSFGLGRRGFREMKSEAVM
jgi:hypothetical protein